MVVRSLAESRDKVLVGPGLAWETAQVDRPRGESDVSVVIEEHEDRRVLVNAVGREDGFALGTGRVDESSARSVADIFESGLDDGEDVLLEGEMGEHPDDKELDGSGGPNPVLWEPGGEEMGESVDGIGDRIVPGEFGVGVHVALEFIAIGKDSMPIDTLTRFFGKTEDDGGDRRDAPTLGVAPNRDSRLGEWRMRCDGRRRRGSRLGGECTVDASEGGAIPIAVHQHDLFTRPDRLVAKRAELDFVRCSLRGRVRTTGRKETEETGGHQYE